VEKKWSAEKGEKVSVVEEEKYNRNVYSFNPYALLILKLISFTKNGLLN
jgi:hypothetical protein